MLLMILSCGVVLLLCRTVPMVNGSEAEHQLYEALMNGYNSLERPVADVSKPVIVKLGIVLMALIDVDEVEQKVTLNVWLNYEWKDYKLKWDAAKFDNISQVLFPTTHLWRPDVLLYNRAEDQRKMGKRKKSDVDASFDSTFPTNLVVYSDGTVNWVPPGIFVISCKIDITWFPFDEQKCYLKFGSWTYDGTKIDLQPGEKGFDLSEYMVNGEWSIDMVKIIRSEKFYDCCPDNPYPDLRFWIYMKRRTLFFGINLIIPCILITLICILGFALPPDAGEKITLQITVLLTECFFLSVVTNMSPPTSEAVPLLGTFFSTCMVLVAAAVFTTVMVLNFHHTSPDFMEMGYFTRSILLHWLPWLLMMHRPGQKLQRKDLPNPFRNPENCQSDISSNDERTTLMSGNNNGVGGDRQSIYVDSGLNFTEKDVDDRINDCYRKMARMKHELNLDGAKQSQLFMIYRVYSELKKITTRMRDEDESTDKQNEWIFAAMVIDRFCLWLLLFFICGSTCYIMFNAPYLIATVIDPSKTPVEIILA